VPVDEVCSSTIKYGLGTPGRSTGGGDNQAKKDKAQESMHGYGTSEGEIMGYRQQKCMKVNFTREHATRRGRSLLASRPYSNHKEEDGMSVWS
jgi:hypothetical protein